MTGEIVECIFDKAGDEDCKMMLATWKKLAQWFLISVPRSLKEYPAWLRRCDHAICVSRFEGAVRADIFCYCYEAASVEEVQAGHAANKFPDISERTQLGFRIDTEFYLRYLDFLIQQMVDASSDHDV